MKSIYLRILGLALAVIVAGTVFWWQGREPVNEQSAQSQRPENSVPESQGDQITEEGGPSYDPISIPALANKQFDGRDLQHHQVLDDNSAYTRFHITYMSGDLKISGIMNLPKGGPGPYPVLILNHGYIDPAVYTNGRGLRREQDYLARRGYVVIHPDYRNHAQSDKDPNADVNFRLGYVEDVINLVHAVKNSSFVFFDKGNIGMLGHSMGGGVTINLITAQPDLIGAAVLFAPVSANQADNFERWTKSRPETAAKIIADHGAPSADSDFWHQDSDVNILYRIKTPVLLHHGTADADVPIEWSDRLNQQLSAIGKDITYHSYQGQPHEFTSSWGQVMQRTVEFFDQNLKN